MFKLLLTSLFIGATGPMLAADASPASSVYPRGDVFPFLGYSGEPSRDRLHSFTMTGPNYGTAFHMDTARRQRQLEKIQRAGMPTVGFLGLQMHFHEPEKSLDLSEQQIREKIAEQVRSLVDDPLVAWWYVSPEELRFWRKNEIDYLRIVTETIRANDPQQRPIWMYEPNHRTGEALAKTGVFQDIIGKGCYTNYAGFEKERIWIRWSIEQECQAIQMLEAGDNRKRFALLMPELMVDPKDPANDHQIPAWIRHDVYLGLISGAKGVAIFSLFRRPGVRRTWPIWYQAYAAVAEELTGELDLGRVFLFGEAAPAVTVQQTRGPESITLFVGDRTKLELGTITEEERQGASHQYPPLSSAVLKYEDATYVFLCNSLADQSLEARITVPERSTVTELPTQKPIESKDDAFTVRLASLQVKTFRVIH